MKVILIIFLKNINLVLCYMVETKSTTQSPGSYDSFTWIGEPNEKSSSN